MRINHEKIIKLATGLLVILTILCIIRIVDKLALNLTCHTAYAEQSIAKEIHP
jgi:hypothetical protein